MNSGVYQIMNKKNYHIYIGSAISFDQRWQTHRRALRKGIHSNIHLQRAWNKYGENSFEFSVVEYIDDVNALETREQWFTDLWNPEYAIRKRCVGSQLGVIPSEETRQKNRDANTGKNNGMYGLIGVNNPNYGKQPWNKGVSLSDEIKRKHAIRMSGENHPMFGRTGENHWAYGSVRSEEQRQKMSERMKKVWERRKSLL